MKSYELIGVIWICGMILIALTWIVLRGRRDRAEAAELADLRARVTRIEELLAATD